MENNNYYKRVQDSVNFLKKWHGEAPPIAIILGSGLAGSVPGIAEMKVAKFAEIPGFKVPNVPGHQGELRIGNLLTSSREFAFLSGRNHAYEGNSVGEVVHNIRSLILWGVKGVIITTASGCLNPSWEVGRMMIMSDHINATGMSPLVGESGELFGPRFIDMSTCYAKDWIEQFEETARAQNRTLYKGIFYGVLGSQYETPAEIKMMQMFGVSAVSMSTVLEVIAAHQLGAKISAFSCFTNYAAGIEKTLLKHADVTSMASRFNEDMLNIILKTAVSLNI